MKVKGGREEEGGGGRREEGENFPQASQEDELLALEAAEDFNEEQEAAPSQLHPNFLLISLASTSQHSLASLQYPINLRSTSRRCHSYLTLTSTSSHLRFPASPEQLDNMPQEVKTWSSRRDQLTFDRTSLLSSWRCPASVTYS
eukprot:755084-Hanusia_phi.AAC.2